MIPIKVNNDIFYEFGSEIPLELATLLGKIVGKSIFENVPIAPRLSNFLLKCILSQDFELDDMKTYDINVLSSMEYIFNNNFDPADLGLTFGYIEGSEVADKHSDIFINDKNKELFLELMLNYYGYQKSYEAINAFLKGIHTVIPRKLLNILHISDLEKLLIGEKTIDVSDWRLHTKYDNMTPFNEKIVEWYWETISGLTQDKLRKLLQF